MSNYIYYRIGGYVFTIILHLSNAFLIQHTLLPPKNKGLEDVTKLIWQFYTVWNICFQTLYAIFGLTCDILTLNHGAEKMAKYISLREQAFAVVWTAGFVVASLFWPVYLYHRDYIYPAFIDEGVPPISNYIMHGAILPILFWELIFLPKYYEKTSHTRNLITITIIFGFYFVWVLYSYFLNGLWPYPFMKTLYGTIYLPIAIAVIYGLMLFSYYHQWPINDLIWGKSKGKEE